MIARIKKDSAPESPEDGDLIANFTRDDMSKYKVDPYEIGPLEDGETYYVRLFPYSDHNVVNINPKFTYHETIKRYYIWGFHQDFTNLDPDSCITYVRDNENWEPMHCCPDTGTFTHGSWDQWSWLQQVRPFMIKRSDGLIDYALDPNDYSKKIDGTASDIGNNNYQSDAYVWFPRLYVKETYDTGNTGRTVLFALDRNNDETSDFKNYYFRGKDNSDTDGYAGYWFGMYYMGRYNYSKPNDIFVKGGDQDYTKDKPLYSLASANQYPSSVSSRWAYGGGIFLNFLRDIEYMLFKSTNIQTHVGLGTPRALNQNPAHTTAMLTNGAFYGRSYRDGAKLFHCPSLGLYAAPITGHTQYNLNSQYITLSTMFGYSEVNCIKRSTSSSIDFITGVHPTKLHLSNLGSIPYSFQYDGSDNNAGSTDTGLCDSLAFKGQYWQTGSSAGIGSCNFYGLGQLCIGAGVTGFNTDKDCGPATIGNSGEATIKAQQYASAKNVVWVSALLPPTKTYTPYND